MPDPRPIKDILSEMEALKRLNEQTGLPIADAFEEGRRDVLERRLPLPETQGVTLDRTTDAFAALFSDSGVPRRFEHMTLDTYRILCNEHGWDGKRDAFRAVLHHAKHGKAPSGKPGLLLHGVPGVGKTGMLAPLALHRMREGDAVLWIQYDDFVRGVQSGYGEGTSEKKLMLARTVPLLVLDDLGSPATRERGKGETIDRVSITWRLINYRHNEMLPMLITSNLSLNALRDQHEARTVERIMESCEVHEVGGVNLRMCTP